MYWSTVTSVLACLVWAGEKPSASGDLDQVIAKVKAAATTEEAAKLIVEFQRKTGKRLEKMGPSISELDRRQLERLKSRMEPVFRLAETKPSPSGCKKAKEEVEFLDASDDIEEDVSGEAKSALLLLQSLCVGQ